jgi:hypothetical protein
MAKCLKALGDEDTTHTSLYQGALHQDSLHQIILHQDNLIIPVTPYFQNRRAQYTTKKFHHRGTKAQKRFNKSLEVKEKLTQFGCSPFYAFNSVPL